MQNITLQKIIFDAIRSREIERAISLFQSNGIDINEFVQDPETGFTFPLITAAINAGRVDVVEKLISLGAKVSQIDEYNVPIVLASERGNTALVKCLLKAGADINECQHTNESGHRTALMAAVSHGQVDLIIFLLERGANPAAKTDDGATALLAPIMHGNAAVVDILLRAGCPICKGCLHGAIKRRQSAIVCKLISLGADPNEKYCGSSMTIFKNQTPLVTAVTREHGEPKPNRDSTAYEDLRRARLEIVNYLLKAGADPNAPSGLLGYSPLLIAVEDGDIDIIRMLISAGASPMAEVSTLGKHISPRQLARRRGKSEIISLLEAK